MKRVLALLATLVGLGGGCSRPMGARAATDAAPPFSAKDADAQSVTDVRSLGIRLDSAVGADLRDARAAAEAASSRDLGTAADSAGPLASEVGDSLGGPAPLRCASQSLVSSFLTPVRGTVRGPKVEGEVCDNGLGTAFFGPYNYSWMTYTQTFSTTEPPATELDKRGPDGASMYGFLLHRPDDALAGVLTGLGLAVPAAAPGSYDSTNNCSSLDFDVTLPIAGAVCSNLYGPCDPGCEYNGGELPLCVPAHRMLHYHTQAGVDCGSYSLQPAQGRWVLTVANVIPLADPGNSLRYTVHGHLQATLVNREDPSDSVELSLDF